MNNNTCFLLVLSSQGLIICLAMTTKNLATNQFALVQFKSHISAPQNALTNNWTSSSSVCNWVGVSCGVIHEKVIALNISNMSLTGTISPHIGMHSPLGS
ncbi:hypothetical protein V6N11_033519 [Hibiscus sabdariffa]|uniref:Leucine-rich repeat-containing N-terminal plant-type domain-containing protein n=1 Tax=Hibiscus sabdariffa TaxID=183260 RepID=A0ABR2PYV0_9ROSI